MLTNARLAELLTVTATIDPVSQAPGAITTGWLSAAMHERFLATVQTGILGAGATIDAKLQQATDNAGTNAKDVAGKAIVQIVKATGDNKQALINLRAEELDMFNNFTFFRLSVTVGVAASLVSAVVQAGVPKTAPASSINQAGVVQNIA